MAKWQPAREASLQAYWADGQLYVVASGSKPTPCHEVDVDQLPIEIHPPEFAVRWRQDGICIQVMTPYRVVEQFPLGEKPDLVHVHTAEGRQEVPVEQREPESGSAGIAAGQEATGYSNGWDFGEALRNAIDALPPASPGGIADNLLRYEVVSSGAEIGGFAGFNRLYVTVRAPARF